MNVEKSKWLMRSLVNKLLVASLLLATTVITNAQRPVPQKDIALVKKMPEQPRPYKMKDWKTIARKQDALLFDFNAKGTFLPLIWWDDSKVNFPIRSFGIPSYVGSVRNKGKKNRYESLPVIGSVLGASLVGIDKSNQHGYDFVTMCRQFYNKSNGVNLIMNNPRRKPGASFWYEIWPGMAFNMLTYKYPDKKEMEEVMLLNANNWLPVVKNLSRNSPYPDFNFTSYDFKTGKGIYNGRWREPDAAAGLGWLFFTAWKRSGNEKFLDAARSCMAYLQHRPAGEGPFYEIMMPYGAYLAVRMNAELATSYDELKMLNWCFDGNNSDRDGWGVMAEKWGNYDMYGLVGQKKWEQYAFAMNTFSHAGALVPIVKYNPAYARTIGKWILNLANASRMFYADEHPRNRQTSAIWDGDPEHVICYEGVRKNLDNNNHFYVFKGVLAEEGPYAVGDQVKNGTSFTDICPYGSAWVGMLAAIVDTTDVKMILQLDCNATDFYGNNEFRTYLYYNPYSVNKTVTLDVGDEPVKLYDAINRQFMKNSFRGKISLEVPADGALLVKLVPERTKTSVRNNQLFAGGGILDYKVK